MTDRDALVAGVLANPDDDTPRLVLADWLDEHGDKRDRDLAAFIRLQCEIARAEPWGAHYRQLLQRDRQAPTNMRPQWLAGLDGRVLNSRLARGFVEEVTIYSKRFVADAADLFAHHPIRVVKFADMRGGRGVAPPAELFACPYLGRLRTLHLVGPAVNDRFVDHLIASPHLSGLRCLRFRGCDVSPDRVRAVVEARSLAGLTELDLGDTSMDAAPTFGSEHLEALAASPGLARLKVLDLDYTAVGTPGVRALATSPRATGLDVLRLGYTGEGTRALRAEAATILAPSPYLKNLRDLTIHSHQLRKKGTEAFARAADWPHLRRLNLRGNEIPPSALAAFAENPKLGTLAELDLTSNPVRRSDVRALRTAFPETLILTDDDT